jgi:two-component system chemotaxis response regulator CheY
LSGHQYEVNMPTCLLVDNSVVVRKVARRIFETMEFETSEAESGPDGLEKCQVAMPDTILLNGNMNKSGGVDFLALLRAMPNGRKPFVIYCTTENDSSEIARALSAGADEYLLKPFDREGICAKLAAGGMETPKR